MTGHRPRVTIVGTIDVDARIELMERLRPEFEPSAMGTTAKQGNAFKEAGLEYSAYSMSRGPRPLGDWIAYRNLIRSFQASKPDIVHTFDTKPCAWGRLAAHAAGVPVVIGTITGLGSLYTSNSPAARILRALYEPLQRRACHRSNLTLFYNHDDRQQFIDSRIVPADGSALIAGSGIRTDRFSRDAVDDSAVRRVRRDADLADDDIVVTMITRVCRSKGVLDFAEAARHLSEDGARIRLLLIGPEDVDARDRLESSELRQVREAVTWLESRDDIAAILAASHIFALPTYYREGIPRVLIEAASMGLPLIATDVPGCREIVRPGTNGELVPPRDPVALANAIRRRVKNAEESVKYGTASREIAVSEYDISTIAERVRDIYRECGDAHQ